MPLISRMTWNWYKTSKRDEDGQRYATDIMIIITYHGAHRSDDKPVVCHLSYIDELLETLVADLHIVRRGNGSMTMPWMAVLMEMIGN